MDGNADQIWARDLMICDLAKHSAAVESPELHGPRAAWDVSARSRHGMAWHLLAGLIS